MAWTSPQLAGARAAAAARAGRACSASEPAADAAARLPGDAAGCSREATRLLARIAPRYALATCDVRGRAIAEIAEIAGDNAGIRLRFASPWAGPSASGADPGLAMKMACWKYGAMKTTLELPDELARRVKMRAVQQDRKLKDVVAQLLEIGLEHAPQQRDPGRPPKPARLAGRAGLSIDDIEGAIESGRG